MATYLAYKCGKGSHDFIFATEQYEPLFQANRTKGKIFGADEYEFVDVKTGVKTPHKVSKTITQKGGAGFSNASASVVASSAFKLDGQDIFDYLANKGYILKLTKSHMFHSELTLFHGDMGVATLTLNVKGERQANVTAIGSKQKNTQIVSEHEDIEALFLAAFLLSRVELSLRLK